VFGKIGNVKKINIGLSFGECGYAVWYIRKKGVGQGKHGRTFLA
jgi:hypothetical protein